MTVVRLGMFETIREAGAGGMGTVWEGKHVVTDTPVAIKFLTAERARDPLYVASLEAEARMIARLEHPRIVRIHDVGAIPKRSTVPGLPPGSPYVVMDWVPRSVSDLPTPIAWENVRGLVLEVLDALAHVHARGIVHRDIKPSNILGRLGRLRLADFGIAQLRSGDESDDHASASGTPNYMAPEQFTTSVGAVGPATDLYAVGCLAYRLCVGQHPFRGESIVELAVEHLHSPFPTHEFTEELAHWFGRMTAKDPRARYPFAADAARVLGKIERAYAKPSVSPTERFVAPDAVDTIPMTTIVLDESSREPSTARIWQVRGRGESRPRSVPDWRASEAGRSHVEHMRGAGLAVSVMRYPPLVGREEERDELWNVFRETVVTGAARATLIVGPDGSGRTRLAHWLAERAHELGIARHLPSMECTVRRDPFLGTVREDLGVGQGEHERARERVESAVFSSEMPKAERNLVIGWLTGDLNGASARSRLDAIRVALDICSGGVPLVLVLDDVDAASPEVLETVHHVARAGLGVALQIVMTSTKPLPDPRGLLHTIELEALDDALVHRIVQNLAGLHPDLAAEVVGAASGNPGHAIALMRGMVERGDLRRGKHGFELVSHAELRLPSMQEVWDGRLAQLVRDMSTARDALEVAAALGAEVKYDEWAAVCEARRIYLSPALPRELDRREFMRRTSVGAWRFADETVRRIVVEGARRRNTWKSHVAACMQVLSDADLVRRAAWELEAGANARAATHFLECARRAERLGEYSRAMRHLNRAREGAGRLGDTDAARRLQVEGDLIKAMLLGRERIEAADDLAQSAVEVATRHGWEDLRAQAHERLGVFARKRVELERAAEHYETAREAYEALGDVQGVGNATQGLGMIAVARGDLARAERYYDGALSAFLSTRHLRGAGWCANGLGDVYRKEGKLDLAASWYQRALNWFETVGDTYGVMWCVHDLAQTRRSQGDLEGAEAGYEETIRLANRLGQRVVAPRLNLGIVRCQRDDFDGARAVFEDVVEESIQRRIRGEEGIARICLTACDAAAGEWDRVAENLRVGRTKIGDLVDADLGEMAAIAGTFARRAAEDSLADELAEFAATHRG